MYKFQEPKATKFGHTKKKDLFIEQNRFVKFY